LPDYNLTVVVLLNCVPHLPGLQQWVLAREIARQTLGPELTPEDKPRIADVTPSSMQTVTGKYNLGHGLLMTVTLETNHLFAEITGRRRFEIFPKSDREFFVSGGNAEATFVRNTNNEVIKAILKQGGDRIDAPKLAR